MVFRFILNVPYNTFSLSHLNTGVILVIIFCICFTLFLDALRHPGSKRFFWRHWWHTPLLVYIFIMFSLVLSALSIPQNIMLYRYSFASSVFLLVIVGIVVCILVVWVLLTSSNPFSLPRRTPQKKRLHWAANTLILLGSFFSLTVLSMNLLLWLTSLIGITILVTGVSRYFTGI
ncbi:MAG: hypothetical protein ACFFCO_12205, partial [Promethearchaeota archaeon]